MANYLQGLNSGQSIDSLKEELQEVISSYEDFETKQEISARRLLEHKISNTRSLIDFETDYRIKADKKRLDNENEINRKLIEMGYAATDVVNNYSLSERLKAIDEEEKAAIKGHRGKVREKIKAEFDEKRKQAEKYDKDRKKLEDKQAKEQAKKLGKELTSAVKSAWSDAGLTDLGGLLFGGKAAKEAIKDQHSDWSDDQVNKAARALRGQAAMDALANFAKQLEGTMNNVASAQTEIDTRLQGLRGNKYMGSYWKQMNLDTTRYVGMSPFLRQEDMVNNLKTLVGKGISFNVEQRAFLETISDKIATTFDATDSTLLKLVRIQQQDTTAARLGMESALTSFLNNMYETTEYMTDAAASVRSQLAEAEALMGASSATEFEYQVQKWMGSLYSIGFSGAEGLSGALGKLAAGDINGLTDGGYGNLLIMAANQAGISITDALEKGLDASKTNNLMEAMVDYLAKIYNDSQGSKVIAQQFANVYGLSASDLKAAANLVGSNKTVASNGLGYSGMLQQLNNMANTIGSRISVGGMMTNMFDNLKFATASSMANDPVLYAAYTIAGMLDDTVGGIAIPSIMAVGSGFDLETTVADLMRVGAVSGGLLGGIGKMLSGLGTGGGFSGSGMLRAFGVGESPNIVTRGNGSGLLTTTMSTLSESGTYVANSEGDDVKNKAMGDATDDANNKVSAAEDESSDIKLKDVNQSVVDIYNLLSDITLGTKSLKVARDDGTPWM